MLPKKRLSGFFGMLSERMPLNEKEEIIMVKLFDTGVYLLKGREIVTEAAEAAQKAGRPVTKEDALKGTIAYHILEAHNQSGDMDHLKMRFDSMTSHDITYVGIIQTARASGMKEFPMPYVLTNCHNSLCAVGGTINEDDHMFALSAAHKYGGVYVPTNMAVIHSYNREMMAGCGKMILGSDSHTRYGALGTLAVGEGGGELAKQLVGRTYDIARPDVILIYLDGEPRPGVGPHDIALQIVGAVYANGYTKNKVMEFAGPGVKKLPMEYRNGIDVMTTETTCWSSVWETDETTEEYLTIHGRPEAYRKLSPPIIRDASISTWQRLNPALLCPCIQAIRLRSGNCWKTRRISCMPARKRRTGRSSEPESTWSARSMTAACGWNRAWWPAAPEALLTIYARSRISFAAGAQATAPLP